MSATHQTYLSDTAADEAVPAPHQRLHRIPDLEHTNSAAMSCDAEDPQRYWTQSPPSTAPRWLLFVAGVMCGAVFSVWVMLP